MCLQVTSLLSGLAYAVRVSATVSPSRSPVSYEVQASAPTAFKTLSVLPAAPPPPLLIVRAREHLKVRMGPDQLHEL